MRRKLAFVAAFVLSAIPVTAFAASPVGEWEVSTGESRYQVTACGDGKQLCAKLTWLRDDAMTEENIAMLNTFVVQGATKVDDASWEGVMSYEGESYVGTVTMVSDDALKVKTCSGILCRSFELNRI